MEMTTPLLLACSCLLSLQALSSYAGQVHGDDRSFRVARVDSLMPASVCFPSKVSGGNSLKIVHRHGPCDPTDAGSKPDHRQALAQDTLRVASIQARLSSGGVGGNASLLQASKVSLPAQRGSGNYVVTLGLGTPRMEQTVDLDTGSDVCWIQCKPCVVSCHTQQQPLFDPSASWSYRNISCASAACRNLNARGCSGGTCLYGIRYGDNSTTVGFLAADTLTLTPTNVFPSFVFGCGQNNQGLFGTEAGLFGLGRGPHSLVSQTAGRLGNVFSYCLPRSSSTTGHLTLGKSTSASSAVYTPMLTDERNPSFYFIDLIGISVGGKRLPVSPVAFRSVGTIIDSGTVITRLPPSAYRALRSAFLSAMSQYPPAQPRGIVDTCYDFSNVQTVSYPPITLHYDGANVTLSFANVFFAADISQVCLAFAANASPSDVGIVGNIQQQTYEVIYDIQARKIGFAARACR